MWQRGPWLLVDRVTGRVSPLKLPDYDPAVSQVSWFRDYGAYCGVTASGKSLYAVVAQLAARKPVLAKKLDAFDPDPEEPSRPGLRPARVAAGAAAGDVSSHRQRAISASTSFRDRRCWSRIQATKRKHRRQSQPPRRTDYEALRL